MIRLLKPLARAFRREERGAASLEFVLVFPAFFVVFISSFEVAMMNLRAVMIERATDIVVRAIRLNTGTNISYTDVLSGICGLTYMIPDCTSSVKIEMRPVDKETWNIIATGIDCVKRDEDIQPVYQFQNGQQNELMLIRVCAVVDPIFPTIGFGRTMPRDSSGGYVVSASSAFVNEPV